SRTCRASTATRPCTACGRTRARSSIHRWWGRLSLLSMRSWGRGAQRPPTKENRPEGLRRAGAAGSAGWPSLNARLSPEPPVSRPHVLRQALPAVPARRRPPRRLSVGRLKACCLKAKRQSDEGAPLVRQIRVVVCDVEPSAADLDAGPERAMRDTAAGRDERKGVAARVAPPAGAQRDRRRHFVLRSRVQLGNVVVRRRP